jgi:hypothetical protein
MLQPFYSLSKKQQRLKCTKRRLCGCGVDKKKWLCKLLPIGLGLVYGILMVVARRQLAVRLHLEDASSSIATSREVFFQGMKGLRETNSSQTIMNFVETGNNNNLWDKSTMIPPWMKEYFSWHKQQRALMTPDNWHNFSYLVMQCATFDQRCGGAADRLKPTTMMVLLASLMKRVLLIHWEKPARLEEFLLPPQGGIDWRIPDYLLPHIGLSEAPIRVPVRMMRKLNSTNITVHVRYQSFNGGSEFYDTHKPYGSANFSTVYHHVWNILFTPHPVIGQMVEDLMELWELQPQEYASIHLRAHYGVEFEKRDNEYIEEWTPNSINCASQLVPGGPFYFASDSSYAIVLAKEYGRQQRSVVVARTNAKEPLHLDKVPDWQQRQPSDYYDTFVDLYLLALGKCVTYSMGGFGSWASLISANSSCWIRHHTAPGITPCDWNDVPARVLQTPRNPQPLFLPPMDEDYHHHVQRSNSVKGQQHQSDDALPVKYMPSVHWQDSTVLPQWMKEYLIWHQEQRNQLHSGNWKQFKYLVVQCCKTDPKCGGTADRLKPVPFLVLAAYLGNRILFIHWDAPKPLEEFLLPPQGGLDWRMPEFLIPRIGSVEHPITAGKRLLRSIHDYPTKRAIHARIQTTHGGSEYFDDARPPGTPNYSEIFREAWRVLFTPVPRIAYQVQTFMNDNGLFPGQYAAAHARLLYVQAKRQRFRIRILTQNALNCASKLYPGVPLFLASDSQDAKDIAWAYGEWKHAKIVARNQSFNQAPVHLDREDAWSYTNGSFVSKAKATKQRNTSAYDDTFVDLYLLAMSRCVAYNKGGFGHWGLLMSYNSSCGFRHQYNANVYRCNWTAGIASSTSPQPDTAAAAATAQELPPLFVRPMVSNQDVVVSGTNQSV